MVAVSLLFGVFLASGEHPDYKRAAEGLPLAKSRAQEMFGTLSWEQYRRETGTVRNVDLSLWKKAADSVPQHIKDYLTSISPTETNLDVYSQDRDWFNEVDALTANLHFEYQLDDYGTDWDYGQFTHSRDLAKALAVGIIGAADEGDAEAVLMIGLAANTLNRALLEEPAAIPALVASAISSITNRAIVRAAVRKRKDKDVVQSLVAIAADIRSWPPIKEIMSAEIRNTQIYL